MGSRPFWLVGLRMSGQPSVFVVQASANAGGGVAAAHASGIVSPVELLIGTRKIIASKQRSKKGSGKGNGKCTIASGWRGRGRGNHHQSAGTEQQAGSQQQPTPAINIGLWPHRDVPRPSRGQNQALPRSPRPTHPAAHAGMLHGPDAKGEPRADWLRAADRSRRWNRFSVRHESVAQPGPAPSVPNAPAAT